MTLRRPLGFSLCLWFFLLMAACCSGEFTQQGTGSAAWVDSSKPPTQNEVNQACTTAKSNATQAANAKCTDKYPKCQLVSWDPCATAPNATAQTVDATVVGHFKCCEK